MKKYPPEGIIPVQCRFPSREDWNSRVISSEYQVMVYTDGSKLDHGVGSAVFSTDLNVSHSFHLPDHSSIFQAEVLAIREACKILTTSCPQDMSVANCSDSQAAIRAVSSTSTSSKLVQQCKAELKLACNGRNITLIWVPGHSNIDGNEIADVLAKQGASGGTRTEKVGPPINHVKYNIHQHFLSEANKRWARSTRYRITKKTWPTYAKKRTEDLLKRDRSEIARIVAVCTGHWPIGTHAARLGIPFNPHCRSCQDTQAEESVTHFLCECPALSSHRLAAFGKRFLDDLSEVANHSFTSILKFLNSTGWI